MYQLWHTKPHTNMTWLWLSISSPTPEGLDDPTPWGRHGLRSWFASSGCIHYCSPLLFTMIYIYIYVYRHHYIYTIIYTPLCIYISQSFSTALALQGYPRSPNAQPFRTRELGAKTQRRTEPLRLTARELSQEIPRVNVKHHHVYHIIHI